MADNDLVLRRLRGGDCDALLTWVGSRDAMIQWAGPRDFSWPLTREQLLNDLEAADDRRTPFAAVREGDDGNALGHVMLTTLPDHPSNKILWIVRSPRGGHSLEITARLAGDPSQVVRISRPPDSEPGEIYPSEVDLPTPGCWKLQLAWGTHRASIDVRVHPGAA